jgi:AcrR family transcriptional regulator
MATRAEAGKEEAPLPRRRLTAAERRSSILDAAAAVFATRGYEAARIDEIASAGGVSKALIYEHFPSKRELYSEIFTGGADEALNRVAAVVKPGMAGIELLEAAIGAFLDFVAERPDIWRVMTQDTVDPTIVALDQRMSRKAVSAIAGLVGSDPGARAQELEASDLLRVAEMIHGATIAIVNWWLENPSTDRDEVATSLMSFLWLGLERTRRGERYEPSRAAGKIE